MLGLRRDTHTWCHKKSLVDAQRNCMGGETDYIKNLFTTVTGGEEEIFPLTVSEIASAQRRLRVFKRYSGKNKKERRGKPRSLPSIT